MLYINPNRPFDYDQGIPEPLLEALDTLDRFGDVYETRTGRMKELIGTQVTLFSEHLVQLDNTFKNYTPTKNYPLDEVPNDNRRPFNLSNQVEYERRLLSGAPIRFFGVSKPTEPYYAKALERLKEASRTLLTDPGSRQVIVTIADVTCMTTWHLQVRYGKLYLIVGARSMHLTMAAHRDVTFLYRHLLLPIATSLNLQVGGMTLNVGNLHKHYGEIE